MPRFLLACHAHTPKCTFGEDTCPARHYVKAKHFAFEDISDILRQIDAESKTSYNTDFTSTNTDTMDVNKMTFCKPTIIGDIFTSIPIGVYDFIIMPDCSGDWFYEQERDTDFQSPQRLFQFHNTMFTNILQALKPGGYLMYSKMVHVRQPDKYLEIMNNWFVTTGMPFKMKHYNTDGMNWFVLYKTPIGKVKVRKVKTLKPQRENKSKKHAVEKKKKGCSNE